MTIRNYPHPGPHSLFSLLRWNEKKTTTKDINILLFIFCTSVGH